MSIHRILREFVSSLAESLDGGNQLTFESLIALLKSREDGTHSFDGVIVDVEDGYVQIRLRQASSTRSRAFMEIRRRVGKISGLITTPGEHAVEVTIDDDASLRRALGLLRRLDARKKHLDSMSAVVEQDEFNALFGGSETSYMRFLRRKSDLLGFVKRHFPRRVPDGIGRKLGSGAEGEVYEHSSGGVIKVFVVPDKETALETIGVIQRVMRRKLPCVVEVTDFGVIGRFALPVVRGDPDWRDAPHVMYYVAERLGDSPATSVEIDDIVLCLKDAGLSAYDVAENPGNTMRDASGRSKYVDLGRTIKREDPKIARRAKR